MSYDEQAMRQVVEDRVAWAVESASNAIRVHATFEDCGRAIAILAAEMLRQLPLNVPDEPNERT